MPHSGLVNMGTDHYWRLGLGHYVSRGWQEVHLTEKTVRYLTECAGKRDHASN